MTACPRCPGKSHTRTCPPQALPPSESGGSKQLQARLFNPNSASPLFFFSFSLHPRVVEIQSAVCTASRLGLSWTSFVFTSSQSTALSCFSSLLRTGLSFRFASSSISRPRSRSRKFFSHLPPVSQTSPTSHLLIHQDVGLLSSVSCRARSASLDSPISLAHRALHLPVILQKSCAAATLATFLSPPSFLANTAGFYRSSASQASVDGTKFFLFIFYAQS